MKRISYGQQSITPEDIDAVVAALKSPNLTQGPLVTEFEQKFAATVGSRFAVAVTSATAALHLCALQMGVKRGSRVLTSSNTFVASANCVRFCDGDVEFVDIDQQNFCIDLNIVESKLKKAKAGTYQGIIPVDFAGYPVNTEELRFLANKFGLWIIEDACHAPGAAFEKSSAQWSKTGSGEFSDLTVFSFHPVKHITTGEGGMITTNDESYYRNLQLLKAHGISRDPNEFQSPGGPWYWEMQQLGYNYRLPDINCALGISQLSRLDQNLERRRQIAARYAVELAGLPLMLPQVSKKVQHAYHLYVVRTLKTETRLLLYEFLKKNNIFTQIHYNPVHQQPYYTALYGKSQLLETEAYYETCLSLPLYHGLTDDEQSFVIDKIKEFFSL